MYIQSEMAPLQWSVRCCLGTSNKKRSGGLVWNEWAICTPRYIAIGQKEE